MKRMINIKRIMGFGVLLSMIITALIPNHVFAANELQLGEYISLGSYNGNELIWRYVGSDENGKLMLSDKMVCYKAFDAAGEHRNSAKSRSSYGSNLWSESNIRCWLNSETEQVDFICGIEPSSENVWMGNYPYNSEHGFLNGFNNDEKTAIKSVSLKTKLNDVDITLSDGEYTSVEMASNTDTTTKTNKYQATTDKIFLMDETQLKMVKDNFKDNYYAKCDGVIGNVSYAVSGSNTGEAYFLRSPNTYEKAADGVCNIRYTDGEIQFDNTMSAYMPCGIRPAFYLADNVDFIDGNGTKEDPFIVSNSGTETSVTQNDNKVLFVTNEDGNIRLYIGNGDKEIVFTDAKPFIDENDRTLIPIRAISESLGYSVDYDDKNRVVTITGDNRIIKLTIGDRNLTVNNEVTEMDTAAQIVNDRTYIPVRFVAEALGYEVNYSATITGWTINENGEIVLNTENGTYDDIKDKH